VLFFKDAVAACWTVADPVTDTVISCVPGTSVTVAPLVLTVTADVVVPAVGEKVPPLTVRVADTWAVDAFSVIDGVTIVTGAVVCDVSVTPPATASVAVAVAVD
jgi:hypothetical protein